MEQKNMQTTKLKILKNKKIKQHLSLNTKEKHIK